MTESPRAQAPKFYLWGEPVRQFIVRQTSFWFATYCLITSIGAPPTVETK